MGIVCTTLALDYYNNGKNHKVAQGFIDYLNSVSMPDITLDFSKNILEAYLLGDNKTQRTETITVEGNPDYSIILMLQNGVTLINETKNTLETEKAKLYGGDKFHLEAPININGAWTSDKILNCKYRFQPIIYRTENSNHQDLIGELTAIQDNASYIYLTVNWLNTGNLIIHKLDAEDKNVVIPGTIFDIYNQENILISTVETDQSGTAKLENIPVGIYKIVEKSTNEIYKIDSKEVEVKVDIGNTEITITNELKKGQIRVIKLDKDNNKITIPGVEFEILDSDMKILETIITDENGEALSDRYPAFNKKYYIKEKNTHDVYVLSNDIKEVNLEEGKVTDIVFENEKKKGRISITKIDSKNEDIKLEGAIFGIYNEDEELITTIITDENGEGTSEELVLGKYFVKEIDTGSKYYLLNEKIFNVQIMEEGENKLLQIDNEKVDINVTVEKKRKR